MPLSFLTNLYFPLCNIKYNVQYWSLKHSVLANKLGQIIVGCEYQGCDHFLLGTMEVGQQFITSLWSDYMQTCSVSIYLSNGEGILFIVIWRVTSRASLREGI